MLGKGGICVLQTSFVRQEKEQDKLKYRFSSHYLKGQLRKIRKTEFNLKGNFMFELSRSNGTKVKLGLYHVKTNSYTKFQGNISKND